MDSIYFILDTGHPWYARAMILCDSLWYEFHPNRNIPVRTRPDKARVLVKLTAPRKRLVKLKARIEAHSPVARMIRYKEDRKDIHTELKRRQWIPPLPANIQ